MTLHSRCADRRGEIAWLSEPLGVPTGFCVAQYCDRRIAACRRAIPRGRCLARPNHSDGTRILGYPWSQPLTYFDPSVNCLPSVEHLP